MGKSSSVDQLIAKLNAAAQAAAKEQKRQITLLGLQMEATFDRQVAGDLGGDNKFSGWHGPELLSTAQKTADGIAFAPRLSSIGPTRVAELGRNMGNAGGFSGPGINVLTGETSRTKTGKLRKVRARKAKRWNGYTKPKHTWTNTVNEIEKTLPEQLRSGFTRACMEVFK